jgi:SEC-C motif-containing protein
MRSRYAAFAVGDGAYLWRTLHEEHEDRAAPRDAFLRAIAGGRGRRYASLAILDARGRGREAEVLFAAGLSERGRDLSFVELSDFEHDGVGWRYRSGILVPRAELEGELEGLGIDAFLAIAGAR